MEKKNIFPENIPINNLEGFLKDLEKKRDSKPIISLYFPSLPNRDTHQQWHSLLHIEKMDTEESKLSSERKKKVLNLLDLLNDYFQKIEEVDYSNTLVLFLSEDFFYSVKVPKILDLTLTLANYPFIRPLQEIEFNENKELVLTIDREEAAIFTLEASRFKELLFFTRDHVPKKVKGGSESWKGLREKKILHHIEWHLNEHMKNVLNNLILILKKRKDIKGIYLGGHKEILPKFEKILPKDIQKMIKGSFISEPDIFVKEAKEKGIQAIYNHKFKARR